MAPSSSDTELLRLIARGDTEALGSLYDRYSSVVYPMVLRIVRDASEAEDVVHDGFLLVGRRAGTYVEERGSVAAWIVTVLRNLSLDRVRRRKRRGALDQRLGEEPRWVETPDDLLAGAAEGTRVRRALEALPKAQRATLERAFFEGLSYPEIAAAEGVPLGTIKSRAARALLTLREILAAEGGAADRPRGAGGAGSDASGAPADDPPDPSDAS